MIGEREISFLKRDEQLELASIMAAKREENKAHPSESTSNKLSRCEVNSRLAPPETITVTRQIRCQHQETSINSDCANNINSAFEFHTKSSIRHIAMHPYCTDRHCRPLSVQWQHHHNHYHHHQDYLKHLEDDQLIEFSTSSARKRIKSRPSFSARRTARAITRGNHQNIFRFAIFCFVLLFTILCCASNSLQQKQFSSTVMATSTTTAPSNRQAVEIDTARVAESNNNYNSNNNGDTNKQGQQMMGSSEQSQHQQQPAIEQVAKAEALTAPIVAASHSLPLPVPQAAALQQQNPAKLFEVCRTQLRTGQQLTNLSQIVFQPSDTCSTWSKMLKSTNADSSSSESYPWHFIEQLNLSHNNLTVLHDSSGMSRLINLLELRITHNQLLRCEESSLQGLQRLQVLDLSHNKLMALPPKFFQPIKNTIKKLNLSFNSISVLVPNLFDSLSQLEYLDLSHNDITSHWINDRLFKNLTQLHYLDLSFNKLTVFSSPATFTSLQQLESLSLQHNELRQVPETIQHLRHLSSLDLSQNFIHDITNASYSANCRLLFNLNLESNLLENITRDAFSDLPALKVLNLANNRIHHLDQQAFDYVPDLHALRLDSNKLTDFGQAFVNLRFLLMLNISSNRISSFDYAHIPLGLQWLDLHSNRIDKLNNFYYSPSAQQQFLASNDIQQQQQQQSIGQQWQSLLRLTTLDASYNLIKELDNTSLPESLETVQLNNNQIRIIASHTFSSKSNLTRINLSHNQLSTLPFDALKLVNNQNQNHRDTNLQLLANVGGHQQQKFVDVYLANNPFVCNCNMGWLSQLLLASSNLMQGSGSIAATSAQAGALPRDHTFTNTYSMVLTRQLPRVADAHLINCHLPSGRQTPFHAVAGATGSLASATIQDLHLWSPVLAANQLAALHHNTASLNHHLLHTVSTSATTSAILSSTTPLILKQSELLSSVHLCSYKSHCFALCYCCDFDACDCEMSCPENCSCYYDQTWSTNIVDCSANNQINGISSQTRFTQMMMGANGGGVSGSSAGGHHLASANSNNNHHHHRQSSSATSFGVGGVQQAHLVKFMNIPEKIPMDVTELYLDGLELLHLRGNALIGRRNLKTLYLNNSHLYSIEPKALATQKSLRILQLNSNFLSELQGHEFEQQAELRELYLANNRLSSIANNTFTMLKSLQILHLQNNQLYHFSFWSNIPAGHRLISTNMGQNPWSCQCDYIEPMLQWLQLNMKHLHDRKSISCQYNTTTALHLLPPSSSSSLNLAAGTSLQTAVNENYPMFDMRFCLNHTVFPAAVVNLNQQQQFVPQQELNEQGNTNYNPYKSLRGAAQDQQTAVAASSTGGEDPLLVNGSYNPSFQPPPNDEPFSSSTSRSQQFSGELDSQQYGQAAPHGTSMGPSGYQFPPPQQHQTVPTTASSATNMSSGRYHAPLLSPSFLFGAVTMICVTLIALVSLIHYRRSMRMWFYTNHGLKMFGSAAAKAHHHHKHHPVGSLGSSGKHHQSAHLSHQYSAAASASSTGSTGSSSAASSNLSQALFQHHQSTVANNSTSGLVTTPLIVTNSNQVLNSATTTTTSYNDDDKLYDAYLTYSKMDEQFVNDFIAPELEYGQPSYRVALHYRDLPVTTSEFLTDCIVETANASRRIIMVLSEQLLRTEWMQYEFRMAHLEALKGTNYKQKLVFILLGPSPNFATADAELLMWLKSCTCICWGDKMFWQRLRFAMPESTIARQQQQYSARYQTLAPHCDSKTMSNSLVGSHTATSGGKPSRNLLGVNNLLKSAGGFLTGNSNFGTASAQHIQQQLVQQHARRPLPMQPTSVGQQQVIAASQTSLYQTPPDMQHEHHYAHLTPTTMIQQQQQQQHTYHQPIYGDPSQQQQQQQQRDSVPVHI